MKRTGDASFSEIFDFSESGSSRIESYEKLFATTVRAKPLSHFDRSNLLVYTSIVDSNDLLKTERLNPWMALDDKLDRHIFINVASAKSAASGTRREQDLVSREPRPGPEASDSAPPVSTGANASSRSAALVLSRGYRTIWLILAFATAFAGWVAAAALKPVEVLSVPLAMFALVATLGLAVTAFVAGAPRPKR